MKFLILLLLIILNGSIAFSQQDLLSGLYFSSYEVNQNKRTALDLSPGESYHFPQGFSLEFDAKFRKGDGWYGYVFRIIGNKDTNIDFVFNAALKTNFSLVYKDQNLLSYNWMDLPDSGYDQWIKVRVDVDIKNSKLALTLNGIKKEATVAGISKLQYFDIGFGACNRKSFLSTDVSPMALKDVRIYKPGGELFRDWKLSKHEKDKVLDETNNFVAAVSNPIWNIDKHIKWQKLNSLQFKDLLGIATDENKGRIFFVGNKAVYILSTNSLKLDTISYAGGFPYQEYLDKSVIYNKYTDELWSFNFDSDQISKFNFQTRKWSLNQSIAFASDFAHQNKVISPKDSSLVTLLGYGHYVYKSIVHHYNLKTQKWEQVNRIDQIDPRYLSGAGFLNDNKLLVFGGYGSKSGKQELLPCFYYDLYSFDLNDYSFKKLWTLNNPSTPFVPCEALVIDAKSNSFYTLIYNPSNYETYLHLAEFNTDKNEYHSYNDSIPFNFRDVQSWSTLFLNKQTSQLIAVAAHDSDISLYSIAYPPLMPDDVYQSVPSKQGWLIWTLGGIGSLGVLLSLLFFLYRRKRDSIQNDGLYKQVDLPNIVPISPIERKRTSSILFFGGFQMYNRKGKSITSDFTPTLKQLFLFIFLHTIKNGKGVTSAKLDEELWYDKSSNSARNNRNVNISKLRTILSQIKGVEVVNENSYWGITIGDPIFCDYRQVLRLLQQSKSKMLNHEEMNELIALLSFGEFLPNMPYEWIDEFRSDFANEIIDGISSMFIEKDVVNSYSLLYHLAECVLIYDPLNEEVLSIKCSVLYHHGKKGMAKNLYDLFCRKYMQTMGTNYSISFNEIIKHTI